MTSYRGEYDPDDPDKLTRLLGATVELYWNDYLALYELHESVPDAEFSDARRAHLRSLDRVGMALRTAIRLLTPDEKATEAIRAYLASLDMSDIPPDRIVERALKQLHKTPLVRDCLRIQLAFEAVDLLLPKAEQRAAHLVAFVAERQLSDRAAAFLKRATQLYLWGFDEECAILCRSVLETALIARLEEFLELDEPPPPLDALIKIAGKQSVLGGYERASNTKGWRAQKGSDLHLAERIKWTGNRVVHDLPHLSGERDGLRNAEEAIGALSQLLDRLYPNK